LVEGKDRSETLGDAACLGLLLGSAPASHTVIPTFGGGAWFAWYVVALMAGLAGASVVCALRSHSAGDEPARTWRILLYALYAVGTMALVLGGQALPRPALLVSGAVAGAASAPVALRACRLARHDLTDNLVLMGAALLVASAMTEVYQLLGAAWARLPLCCALVVGLALLEARITSPAPGTQATEGEVPLAARERARRFADVLGIPLLGVFAYAVFLKTGADGGARPTLLGMDEELAAYALAATTLLATGLSRPQRPVYAAMYRVVTPICIIVILVLQSFPHGSPAYAAAGMVVVFVTALVMQFALAVTLTIAEARGRSDGRVAGTACPLLVTYALGRVCSLALHGWVARGEVDEYSCYQVIMTCLLALMLVLVLLQYRHDSVASAREARDGAPAANSAEIIAATSDRLASEHGLSAREAEVLRLLARGYAPAYIADELVIADSTVRTHVKSIYRKLGVTSREALIDLVTESEEKGQ
jgi:DNA-binding CsgD family transcriptional regulator